MNKQFIYNNDKVYITDENGNINERKYYDQILNELSIENEVEVLNMELLDDSKKLEQAKKSLKSNISCLTSIILGLTLPITTYYICTLITAYYYNVSFDDVKKMITIYTPRFPNGVDSTYIYSLVVSSISVPVGVIKSALDYALNANKKKDIKKLKSDITNIKIQLGAKLAELKELKENKTNNKIYKDNDIVDIYTKKLVRENKHE